MYISASDFYKQVFGSKVYKIALNAGCTCPTRDGTKGYGGCKFCSASGSGDFVPETILPLQQQLEQAKQLVNSKYSSNTTEKKYIAYFQNFTNTYGNIFDIKKKWELVLLDSQIAGLAIGTRPDCINEQVCEVLCELSKKTFIQLELGFQTSNEQSAAFFNRGYDNQTYFSAVELIKKMAPEVHVVTHVIFGLPAGENNKIESEQQMMESVKAVVAAKSDGIKITALYVLKNTGFEQLYLQNKFRVLEMDEYINLVEKALRLIPDSMIVHRITGDPPKKDIIAPLWTTDKKRVMNAMQKLKD